MAYSDMESGIKPSKAALFGDLHSFHADVACGSSWLWQILLFHGLSLLDLELKLCKMFAGTTSAVAARSSNAHCGLKHRLAQHPGAFSFPELF